MIKERPLTHNSIPTEINLQNEDKTLSDKWKWKNVSTADLALQKCSQFTEGKWFQTETAIYTKEYRPTEMEEL